jgi:hypothetical protein
MTTNNTYKRDTAILPAGFEPAIPKSERPQSHALNRSASGIGAVNPLTPELNPSAQRCLTRFFTGDFVSLTVHFVNICVKHQQLHQLFILFINYVW